MSLYSGLAYGRAHWDDGKGWQQDIPSAEKTFRFSKLFGLAKNNSVPARMNSQPNVRPRLADGLELAY